MPSICSKKKTRQNTGMSISRLILIMPIIWENDLSKWQSNQFVEYNFERCYDGYAQKAFCFNKEWNNED